MSVRNYEGRVKKLIEARPDLGEDDQRLYLAYIATYDGVKIADGKFTVDDFLSASPFESISRGRRKVAENFPELFSEQVQEARYQKYVETKDAHSISGVEFVEDENGKRVARML